MNWKVFGIIFFILFVVETIAIISIMKIGLDEIQREEKCAMDICQDYTSYIYFNNVCECYDNGEFKLRSYLD